MDSPCQDRRQVRFQRLDGFFIEQRGTDAEFVAPPRRLRETNVALAVRPKRLQPSSTLEQRLRAGRVRQRVVLADAMLDQLRVLAGDRLVAGGGRGLAGGPEGKGQGREGARGGGGHRPAGSAITR